MIADFGQARGGNTATNLPNEGYLVERYGSIILLRANIMRDPDIFGGGNRIWSSAMSRDVHADVLSLLKWLRSMLSPFATVSIVAAVAATIALIESLVVGR